MFADVDALGGVHDAATLEVEVALRRCCIVSQCIVDASAGVRSKQVTCLAVLALWQSEVSLVSFVDESCAIGRAPVEANC